MLVFLLAPIVTLFYKRFLPSISSKQTTKFLVLILIIVGVGLEYVYSTMPEVFEGYLHTFTKAFDKNEESIRFNQANMLMGHFKDNPIFGAGSGAVFYESDRGIRQHQFEQTYLLLLATRGVIGFTFYVLGTIGGLLYGIKCARKRKDALFLCMLFAFFFVLLLL